MQCARSVTSDQQHASNAGYSAAAVLTCLLAAAAAAFASVVQTKWHGT
jgi:hypothetical protein